MKTLTLTRKLKVELTRHYKRGGLPQNVPGDLARVSLSDRQRVYDYWRTGRGPRLDPNMTC